MTTPYAFDDSRTELGSQLAAGIAVVAAFVLGVSAGYPVQTTLGVVGGVLFGFASGDLGEDALRRRVRGSILLVTASVFVVTALFLKKNGLFDAVLIGMVPLAVGATTLGSVTTFDETATKVLSALLRSFVVLVAGTLLGSAIYGRLFTEGLPVLWHVFGTGVTGSPFFGFVALQIEFLLIGLLAGKAGRAAADLDPARTVGDEAPPGVRDVPLGVWVLIAFQLLVLALPGGAALFGALLGLTGPVGSIVSTAFTSIYLHAALLLVVAVLAILPVVSLLRTAVIKMVGNRPPKSFAYATGGVTFVVTIIALTSLPPVVTVVKWLARGNELASNAFTAYGVGPTFLGAVTGVLAVTAVLLFFVIAVTGFSVVPDRAAGFVFGSIGLFVAACAGAFTNAPAPAVFLAMAGAIVTWDLGDYATTLGREIGSTAPSRSVLVVHSLGSLATAAVAVVVASLATHFLVPLMIGIDQQRAITALGLLMVALVTFAYLADSAPDSTAESDD